MVNVNDVYANVTENKVVVRPQYNHIINKLMYTTSFTDAV